ncbi:MAG: PEP-CTERM sorting domain-containing protein [Sphingomonadales bacterium]|nr:PEP-CTERM sorting domain-containing protein [Sphingomonadales bacterium]
MKTRWTLAAISIAAGSLFAGQAQAALVTDVVTFSANNLQTAFGDPVPVDPVMGSFTIQYDPTLTYTDSTSGITLNSLNIALGSALSFSYDPNNASGSLAAGTLIVGGLAGGAGIVQFLPPSNDFWLFINNFATAPAFNQLGYSQAAALDRSLFFTLDGTGSVSVRPFVADTSGVPEPATWAMMVVGLGLVGATMRRRARQTVSYRFA